MSALTFWAFSLTYLAAAVAATFAGPRGLRRAAAGVSVTFVLSTVVGALPASMRPSVSILDVGSSFLLACWILLAAFRYPTAWSGGLLVLQGIELALGAASLGPEAELLREPFTKALSVLNGAIISYFIVAVAVKQLDNWKRTSTRASLAAASSS